MPLNIARYLVWGEWAKRRPLLQRWDRVPISWNLLHSVPFHHGQRWSGQVGQRSPLRVLDCQMMGQGLKELTERTSESLWTMMMDHDQCLSLHRRNSLLIKTRRSLLCTSTVDNKLTLRPVLVTVLVRRLGARNSVAGDERGERFVDT